jgi:hypothetical protein
MNIMGFGAWRDTTAAFAHRVGESSAPPAIRQARRQAPSPVREFALKAPAESRRRRQRRGRPVTRKRLEIPQLAESDHALR